MPFKNREIGYFIFVTMRDQIITELKRTKFVENYARRFAFGAEAVYFDDIVAELYMQICELPTSLMVQIYEGCGINCFRRYVSGLIIRQLRSKNSKIYKKYTLHVKIEEPVESMSKWANVPNK